MPKGVKIFKNPGFTLIEVLLVVVLIAALAALAYPNYFVTVETARSQEARSDLQQIQTGEGMYHINYGVFWDPADPPAAGDVDTVLRTARGLRRLAGIPSPRIAVLGLNPHAGEGGLFGAEEARVIAPAVRAARRAGIRAEGPLAADGAFGRWK